MSTNFDENHYKHLKEQFRVIFKRIQPYEKSRALTKDEKLLSDYQEDIIRVFNDLAEYLGSFFDMTDSDGKETPIDYLKPYILKVQRTFKVLSLTCEWSTDDFFELIDEERVEKNLATGSSENAQLLDFQEDSDSDTEEANDPKEIADLSQVRIVGTNSPLSSTAIDENLETDHTPNIIINEHLENHQVSDIDNSEDNTEVTMPQTRGDLVKLAAQTITTTYSGDPTALKRFLTSIELAKLLCEEDNIPTLKTFILTKLEGKASELVPEDALENNIKPESSRVIKGHI